MLAVSLVFNFPSCYRNRKTFGGNMCDPKYQLYTDKKKDENRKLKYRPRNPNLLSITRFICDSLLLIVSFALVVIFYTFKDDENNVVFNDINPSKETQNTKKLLLPNICFSSIYNMGLHLFLPFINDAYYYNTNSSFDSENYKRLFYNDDYDITVLGNLINEAESVKMIGYNVINREKDIEVTILSIKGTSFNKDMYLDAQLFISSILMTLLNTFSLITQKNLWSFKIMEYSLSIPYRIFFKHLIVDEYIKKLEYAYNATEYQFFDNVVIVGHSLGGGLAKLFGRMVKKQAISLSGPGINAFHSLWNYKGESENFEISAIDLVPDRDLVPRVEVSGGTTYRIICKFGALGCHSKVNSLCEVLIMCNIPSYKEYCMKVADLNNEQINSISESIDLN
jgi:lipase ATG15